MAPFHLKNEVFRVGNERKHARIRRAAMSGPWWMTLQRWTQQREDLRRKSGEATPRDVQPAAIAVHDERGRIHVNIVADEAIDLTPLQAPDSRNNVAAAPATSQQDVPQMSICIMIVGTRGDVQPFIGIAKRLQHDGHRVRLATHAVYRDFVTEHGVEFYPLGGDPKELAAYMVKTGGHLIPLKYENITQDVPRNLQMLEEILNSTWPAVSAPDPDGLGKGVPGAPFQAQAIISNPVTYGHIHVAERLGVPLHIMFPQPWVPTVAFPHPLSNMPYNDKPQKRNYMSYKLVDLLMWQGTEGMVNQFRTQVLGLRKIRKGDGGRDILLDLAIPHAFMWSPALVPKPADWGDIYDVIGTVLLKEAGSSYSPTPELEAFLGTDGGPIFVGFGSMVIEDPAATTKMIIEAARLANVRVLIQSSWSDMSSGLDVPDNIFFLGNCPHDWLMPRVSAVVHHGGAGTTAAGLLAGKPTFIVPFFGDQPFWGQAVVKAGVGVKPCPIADLTVEKLRAAFVGLQTPEIRKRALELRDVMNREDGAGEAVRSFYRHLPLKNMRCEVCTKQLATKWSVSDKVRLCDSCHFVVSSEPKLSKKEFVEYRYVKYNGRGPSSGVAGASAGVGALLHEVGGAVKDVFVKPAKGFRHDGAKGVAIGFARGIGGLVVRPIYGVALLADHIATGHANFTRPDGAKKRGTVFDNRIQYAIGHEDESDGYVVPGMSKGEIEDRVEAAARKKLRRKIIVNLSDDEQDDFRRKYNEVIRLRHDHVLASDQKLLTLLPQESNDTSSPVNMHTIDTPAEPPTASVHLRTAKIDRQGSVTMEFVGDDTIDEAVVQSWREFWKNKKKAHRDVLALHSDPPHVPTMNICLATIGTWHHNVKQFVAIGLRLAKDGHRVRVAADERFREEVTGRGLKFYPLQGSPKNMHELLRHLNNPHPARRHSTVRTDIRSALFSLWPAVTAPDPDGRGQSIPGDPFRADFLICHPLLVTHVHIAERLGIPVHCVSLTPLSPTFAFPHVLSSYLEKTKLVDDPSDYRKSNYLSYQVVDSILWHALNDIVEDFRTHIGLPRGWHRTSLLVDWEVPHTYLWEPSAINRPLDWGPHISVAGYITLDDAVERARWSKHKAFRSLNEFVLATGAPCVYVGFSRESLGDDCVASLLDRLDAAARRSQVHIIVQIFGPRVNSSTFHSDNVYEVDQDIPFALLLRKVVATLHWGCPSMTWEGLEAGKPVCIWPRLSTQRWFADVLAATGFGPSPVDLASMAVSEMVGTLDALVSLELRSRVADRASQFSHRTALERVVEFLYSGLPLPAMVCDLDKSKVAHVYDVVDEMKLSYEAHFALRHVRSRSDQNRDVPYKPLYYSGSRPPKYSLRGIRGEPRVPALPVMPMSLESVSAVLSAVVGRDEPPTATAARVFKRQMSFLPVVEARPRFWSTAEEEASARARVLAQYEVLMKR